MCECKCKSILKGMRGILESYNEQGLEIGNEDRFEDEAKRYYYSEGTMEVLDKIDDLLLKYE